MSALAFASFSLLFVLLFGLFLFAAIFIHEIGHWLAMRATGQPRPRIVLIPFFGGAAVPNHPYKTQFDHAFVALAGAGFSVLPCLGLLAVALALNTPEIAKAAKMAPSDLLWYENHRQWLLMVIVVAAVNALQLLPMLPLDGGHVLKTIMQSVAARRARIVLLVLAGLGFAGFAILGDYILAAFLAVGAMQAWHVGDETPDARPMGASGITAIGASYALILGIHGGVLVYSFRLLGVDLI